MTLNALLRWPLKAMLALLRRHPVVYFKALSLLMRWPWGYRLLRRWLFQEPQGMPSAAAWEPASSNFPHRDTPPSKLTPLGPCSSPTLVAQRRLQRALWQQPRG